MARRGKWWEPSFTWFIMWHLNLQHWLGTSLSLSFPPSFLTVSENCTDRKRSTSNSDLGSLSLPRSGNALVVFGMASCLTVADGSIVPYHSCSGQPLPMLLLALCCWRDSFDQPSNTFKQNLTKDGAENGQNGLKAMHRKVSRWTHVRSFWGRCRMLFWRSRWGLSLSI